jgi:hypothetical protein
MLNVQLHKIDEITPKEVWTARQCSMSSFIGTKKSGRHDNAQCPASKRDKFTPTSGRHDNAQCPALEENKIAPKEVWTARQCSMSSFIKGQNHSRRSQDGTTVLNVLLHRDKEVWTARQCSISSFIKGQNHPKEVRTARQCSISRLYNEGKCKDNKVPEEAWTARQCSLPSFLWQKTHAGSPSAEVEKMTFPFGSTVRTYVRQTLVKVYQCVRESRERYLINSKFV